MMGISIVLLVAMRGWVIIWNGTIIAIMVIGAKESVKTLIL